MIFLRVKISANQKSSFVAITTCWAGIEYIQNIFSAIFICNYLRAEHFHLNVMSCCWTPDNLISVLYSIYLSFVVLVANKSRFP